MKYRTGFVTNSSSASYSVTITLEDRKKHSLALNISTYDGYSYYEDTRDGCGIYPEGSKSLSYIVPYVFQRSDPSSFPPELGSLRNLAKLLLSSVNIYGYGYSYDWWRSRDAQEYFKNRWLKERLLEVKAGNISEDEIDVSDFDFEYYLAVLKNQGIVMLDNDTSDYGKHVDNICEGWRFAIAGEPSIYFGRGDLEEYIFEHGGEVDECMGNETDFLISCVNPSKDLAGEPFWQDEYKEREGQWGIWRERDNDEHGDFADFLESFDYPDRHFELFFDESDDVFAELSRWDVSCKDFVISEAEFVRRFDPQRERDKGMKVIKAYPLLIMRLEQVCKNRGINPDDLSTITYHYRINTFGDSCYELGFYWKDEGITIDLRNGKAKRWHKMN